jgi:hypothetical protein
VESSGFLRLTYRNSDVACPEAQCITSSVLPAVVSSVVPTGARPWLEEVKRDIGHGL